MSTPLTIASFRRALLAAALGFGAAGAGVAAEPVGADTFAVAQMAIESAFSERIKPLLATHCYPCHGKQKQKADLNLETMQSPAEALRARKTWKAVHTALVEREMPPEEAKAQPTDAERGLLTAWIASLKTGDRPDPGRTTLHRLNRAEYQHTIRDLVGVDYRADAEFPKDDVSDGFDNIAQTLSLSPLLIEKYLLAADTILDRALTPETVVLRCGAGELDAVIGSSASPGQLGGKQRLLTTGAELTRTLTIAHDGEYIIAVRAGSDPGSDGVSATVTITLLNERPLARIFHLTSPTTSPAVISRRVMLSAGEHKLTVSVRFPLEPPAAPSSPRCTVLIENIDVLGPPPPSDATAQHLLIATPGPGVSPHEAATRIAKRFADRAYRRPATSEQLALLVKIFDLASAQGRSFPRAIKEMLKAALVAPEFLFRIERDRPADVNGVYRIDDYDLASRLSYFLWSSQPDDRLFELAAQGTLHHSDVLRAEVQRLIADPKAQRFIDSFAGQWLLLRNVLREVGRVDADATTKKKQDGGLSTELRQAMFAEGTALFGHILRQGRSVRDFIDPDYTFLNEALALHYGVAGVSGEGMRLVQLPDRRRGGVLTLGALMVVNSHPGRTSPTQRGRWVLEEIIGKPPPPPPPDIPQIQFTSQKHPNATERQVLEIHREKPACANCHKVMDPIGFGLENFDNQGRWRDKIKDAVIDVTGELPGKRTFNGPAELKAIIASYTDDLVRVLAERVLTYALGRALSYHDDEAVDAIVAKAIANGHRFDIIITETVLSFPFTHRRLSRETARETARDTIREPALNRKLP